MKTIGLIGGMSWESTALYYRLINETVKARLGGLRSAKLVLLSVDFHDIEAMQRAHDWTAAAGAMADAARRLDAAGAQCIVLATNTMHKVADAIERATTRPLLHIADPTAAAIRAAGYRRIGLLGTAFTMAEAFYRDRLAARHGLDVIVPEADDAQCVHRIIYDELCLGRVLEPSRQRYREVMAKLVARGAEAIILGCTEITMLVGTADATVPLFDTTELHARGAANWAMGIDAPD